MTWLERFWDWRFRQDWSLLGLASFFANYNLSAAHDNLLAVVKQRDQARQVAEKVRYEWSQDDRHADEIQFPWEKSA